VDFFNKLVRGRTSNLDAHLRSITMVCHIMLPSLLEDLSLRVHEETVLCLSYLIFLPT
jgi:hypothetical protein